MSTGTSEVEFAAGEGRGRLRGRLRLAADGAPPQGAAVLCHPHPAFGGNMDVWLLPMLGQALAADGWHVLRFDFGSVRHGVDPDGAANGHAAERADLRAALAFLRQRGLRDGPRLALGGWSFGALVALLHGLDEPDVTDWVGIAPALGPLPDLPMAPVPADRVAAWRARRVVIAGRHDQFFPAEAMASLDAAELHVLDDCDHFFFDRDRDLAELVTASLRRGRW